MEYIRGHRAYLNMIRDPVDNYIEHKDEIDAVLEPFTTIPPKFSINVKQQIYISSTCQDKNYVKAVEIRKGDKIYCKGEGILYELDKELNELGFKTKISRNCDAETLSIVILEEPETT